MASRILAAAAIVGLALYPLLVLLLAGVSPAGLPVALLALLGAIRLATIRGVKPSARLSAGVALLAFCTTAWLGSRLGLVKLYPVLISGAGLTYCLWTLVQPPSAAERLARGWYPQEHFDDRKRTYTRRVTQVWAGFFLFNGTAAAYTAFGMPIEIWAIYNGIVSYVLIGILFGGEYAIRCAFRRKYHAHAPTTP